jgi:hypothetical protein
MVIPNLYYYSSYFLKLLQVYISNIFSISNYKIDVLLMFEPSCKLIHIFWNLIISIMIMLNLSKLSFYLCRFKMLRTYFSIWITNAFCVYNMVKHALNTLWGSHRNEFLKWKVMIIFYVYFVQNGTIASNFFKWAKIGWKKSKHNILSF